MMRTLIVSILTVLICNSAGLCAVAPDPLRIAAGARCLGMGRAHVSLSGDINLIYTNPAGISTLDNWQLTSMSARLLNEYDYLNLAGVFPTERFGNFGMSFSTVGVGGAFPTKIAEGSDPSDLVYEWDPAKSPINYSNILILLSYGSKLAAPLSLPPLSGFGQRFPWLNDVSYGANLKFYNVGMTGGGLSDASGHGFELDLGLQSRTGLDWLSVGLSLQNVLPASLGGKMVYDYNNWEETFPVLVKPGIAVNLLGEQDAIRSFRGQKLKLLLDADLEPTRPQVPSLLKLG
ncbi:hypothetical protein ACFL37_02000, partial [Candidatus Margulisiibacteriota bacterium]